MRCKVCGRRLVQQFGDLRHCKCGISYIKQGRHWVGFERTVNMVFRLNRKHKAMVFVREI